MDRSSAEERAGRFMLIHGTCSQQIVSLWAHVICPTSSPSLPLSLVSQVTLSLQYTAVYHSLHECVCVFGCTRIPSTYLPNLHFLCLCECVCVCARARVPPTYLPVWDFLCLCECVCVCVCVCVFVIVWLVCITCVSL